MAFGAADRDVELSIVTDDGLYCVGRWIRNALSCHAGMRTTHTVSVGFRFSRKGQAGQGASRAKRRAASIFTHRLIGSAGQVRRPRI